MILRRSALPAVFAWFVAALLAVVPAVFLVDRTQLEEGEEAPRTWKEILGPRFEGRIAMPVGDFDLFNGILLTIWKHFGDDGVCTGYEFIDRYGRPLVLDQAGRHLGGESEAFDTAEALCRTMFAPVADAHRVTVDQMAILEPAMAEVCAAAAAS